MTNQLTFEATCGGRVIGQVVVYGGVATARVGDVCLEGVLFGHALMWLREHCHGREEVRFRLVIGDEATAA